MSTIDYIDAMYNKKTLSLENLEGTPGPQGEAGSQGDQGIQGEPGTQGDTGVQGDVGSQGPQGDTGDQGPPGEGGSGVDIKGGSEINLSCGGSQIISFITPFSSTPNVVCTEDITSGKDHSITVSIISVNGFTLNIQKNHTGGACSNVGVQWIATDMGNP